MAAAFCKKILNKMISNKKHRPLALVYINLAVVALVARLAGALVVVDQVLARSSVEAGQQLAVVNVLGAVPAGVSRITLTEVVSDLVQASSVLAGLRSTLVNVELTRLALQSSLALALVVVDEIVAV